MTSAADQYLTSVLQNHEVFDLSDYREELDFLFDVLKEWAHDCYDCIIISGSRAKNTAVFPSSDVDIVVSLSSKCNDGNGGLRGLNSSFVAEMKTHYPNLREQNVSVGLNLSGLAVDVTPARKVPNFTHKHWIYSTKKQSYVQTNVRRHIIDIAKSGRTKEIKLLKIWREKNSLDFPSVYMEYLLTFQILSGRSLSNLSDNLGHVFNELARDVSNPLLNCRIEDPSNTNNILSDLLTTVEKRRIIKSAKIAQAADYWESVFE
ncbi:nucleotidyltransferase family protein [Hirschia maritima]|uniref:hypothetical protein n=1 Tax=Hirschia maritima TaxID=1121961 RepID=UPI0003658AA9|nr:hypothetical protein [Hirschia maritima]